MPVILGKHCGVLSQYGACMNHATVSLMGIPIAAVRPPELFALVEQAIRLWSRTTPSGRPTTLAYANAHSCNLFIEYGEYQRAMLDMDLIYLDGNGPRLAAWLAGDQLLPRMTAVDWIDDFCSFCSIQGISLYFLGASEGVAAQAARVLRQRHPSLNISGHHHGFFDEAQSTQIIFAINQLQPDILVLAMGSPRQECWTLNHRQELQVPVIWNAGGVLDIVSGRTPRAPLLMRRLGLEWLGRLLLEPHRLWQRYLVGIPKFVLRSLKYALSARVRPSVQ
jgi:N-acetylglucosaminyldiphosphoundecaprenol N-acetyl-beta-D-mannosaminyltransferase